MGGAVVFVITLSSLVSSILYKLVIQKLNLEYLKTIIFIVVIAFLVQLVEVFLKKAVPSLYKSLGIYLPLIVVNCIILGRAEAFACKNGPLQSIFDGIGMGLGFSLALTLLGAVRELLGAGSIFGIGLLPETCNMLLFILPPGAFITLGYLIAIVNKFKKA